ncbi:hypothetical protein ACFYXL_10975 [Streptomyces tsukubensis]|uniref:hypothetical protein n=1 Tax=Streptomyces tsukubensis TaxID=83656 RepID=UPI0036BB576E
MRRQDGGEQREHQQQGEGRTECEQRMDGERPGDRDDHGADHDERADRDGAVARPVRRPAALEPGTGGPDGSRVTSAERTARPSIRAND